VETTVNKCTTLVHVCGVTRGWDYITKVKHATTKVFYSWELQLPAECSTLLVQKHRDFPLTLYIHTSPQDTHVPTSSGLSKWTAHALGNLSHLSLILFQ